MFEIKEELDRLREEYELTCAAWDALFKGVTHRTAFAPEQSGYMY